MKRVGPRRALCSFTTYLHPVRLIRNLHLWSVDAFVQSQIEMWEKKILHTNDVILYTQGQVNKRGNVMCVHMNTMANQHTKFNVYMFVCFKLYFFLLFHVLYSRDLKGIFLIYLKMCEFLTSFKRLKFLIMAHRHLDVNAVIHGIKPTDYHRVPLQSHLRAFQVIVTFSCPHLHCFTSLVSTAAAAAGSSGGQIDPNIDNIDTNIGLDID